MEGRLTGLTKVLFFTFIMSLLIGSCTLGHSHNSENINQKESAMAKPAMAHNVYFWLKEGTSEDQIKAFERGLQKLGTVPSIMSYYWGPPAPTEDRNVIDNSYAYSINALFQKLEDQEKYQKDPIHLEFIKNHQDIWETVKVYDNLTN